MEFCEECGSMMKKFDGEWICSNCSPEKVESASSTRKAVVLTCPICQKQRPYCGIDGKLAPIKWKQGIDYHLDYHELDNEVKEKYCQKARNEKTIKEIPQRICEEARDRGWDHYGL